MVHFEDHVMWEICTFSFFICASFVFRFLVRCLCNDDGRTRAAQAGDEGDPHPRKAKRKDVGTGANPDLWR